MKTSRFVVADAGKVAGTTALSSPVRAHGPVEEFYLFIYLFIYKLMKYRTILMK